jgi:hypothetical protein
VLDRCICLHINFSDSWELIKSFVGLLLRGFKMPRDYIISEKAIESILPLLCERCQVKVKDKIHKLAKKTADMIGEFLEII